jgi:hypothetical protein
VVAPVFLDAPLVLNKGVLMTLSGRDDSANYLDGQLKSAGDTLAQVIGTSIYGSTTGTGTDGTGGDGYIGSITAITSQFSSGTGVFTVGSPAGLKEGMSITLINQALSRAFILRVAGVTLSAADFSASITLVNDVVGVAATGNNTNAALAAITFAIGDDLAPRGMYTNEGVASNTVLATATDGGGGPVNLSVLSGSGTVYGISAANCLATGFVGNAWTGVGEATQEAFLLRMKRVHQKSGDMPDLVCVGPMTSAILGFSALTPATAGGLGTDIVGQTRRSVDGKLDKYGRDAISGSGVSLGGKEVLEDVNLGDASAFILSRQYTKLGVWQDIEAEKQGGDTLLVQQTAFAKVAFFNAAFNVMCTKRSSVGKLSGLAVAFL